jgi:hypothetical protein
MMGSQNNNDNNKNLYMTNMFEDPDSLNFFLSEFQEMWLSI